jgi:uncharacterized protein YbjQ (UPF0145 family)
MSFKTVVSDIGKVSLNIVDGHYIAKALTFSEKAASVIATAIKDSPQLKAALTELVTKAEAIGADAVVDAAGKGINLAADAKTLADAEAFFTWIISTLVPLVESVYSEVKTDLTATNTTTVTVTTTA